MIMLVSYDCFIFLFYGVWDGMARYPHFHIGLIDTLKSIPL